MKKILLIIMMALPVAGFCGVWSSSGEITNISSSASSGSVWITMSVAHVNDGCQNNSPYILPHTNTAGFNRVYAALLTAFSTGKKINVFINGCTNNTARITNIRLK